MFNEKQKESMRLVFGHMYKTGNKLHSIYETARDMDSTTDLMSKIFRALVVCNFIDTHYDDEAVLSFVLTEKGITRYEAYLALQDHDNYTGDNKHSPDYYHK